MYVSLINFSSHLGQLAQPFFSLQLRDYWMNEMARSGSKALRTNVADGISKMTLDVIGLAGESFCSP